MSIDYKPYINITKENNINVFKSKIEYRGIVETVSNELGQKYLNLILLI